MLDSRVVLYARNLLCRRRDKLSKRECQEQVDGHDIEQEGHLDLQAMPCCRVNKEGTAGIESLVQWSFPVLWLLHKPTLPALSPLLTRS